MTDKLMKGHTWSKGKHRMTYPADAEVKIDEIRLDVRLEGGKVLFHSYADKPLHNLGQFHATFLAYMLAHRYTRLDMGVLVNGTFADTYRYVRSSRGIPNDLLGAGVRFILFDVPDYQHVRFAERREIRARVRQELRDAGLIMLPNFSHVVHSEDEVIPLYTQIRDEGHEGLMLKSRDHIYEPGKRTYGWLKVKPEEEADALVTGVNEAHTYDTGEPLGRAGSLSVTCEDGSTAAVAGIPHDIGRAWFEDPSLIVGQWITFEYMERDRQGGYRHPRFGRLREAKA